MDARERYNSLYARGQAQVAVATLKRLGTFVDGMAARHLTPEEMDQIDDEDWPGPWAFKPPKRSFFTQILVDVRGVLRAWPAAATVLVLAGFVAGLIVAVIV